MDKANDNARDAYSAIGKLLASTPSLTGALKDRLRFHGSAPHFDSPHKLTVSAAAAIGAFAAGVEQWWHLAKGQHQTVAIDWMQGKHPTSTVLTHRWQSDVRRRASTEAGQIPC